MLNIIQVSDIVSEISGKAQSSIPNHSECPIF